MSTYLAVEYEYVPCCRMSTYLAAEEEGQCHGGGTLRVNEQNYVGQVGLNPLPQKVSASNQKNAFMIE